MTATIGEILKILCGTIYVKHNLKEYVYKRLHY